MPRVAEICMGSIDIIAGGRVLESRRQESVFDLFKIGIGPGRSRHDGRAPCAALPSPQHGA
jgi:hypothetical protein